MKARPIARGQAMSEFGRMGVVVRNIERADAVRGRAPRAATAWRPCTRRRGAPGCCKPHMRPAWPGAAVCGTAVTVLAQPGDNWMLHVAAEMIRPGDIVVVACTTDNDDGMFGDLLATSYRARGGARARHRRRRARRAHARRDEVPGLVARDPRARHGQGDARLGQRAGRLRRHARAPGRRDRRRRRRRGGRAARRASPRSRRPPRRARRRRRRTRKRLAAGELGLDIYGMRETLAKAGLKYLD